MNTKPTLILLGVLIFSGCISIFPPHAEYGRLVFDLHVTGSDFSGTRYLDLHDLAGTLRYNEVDGVVKLKSETDYHLKSSNGICKDKHGNRMEPGILGEMYLILPKELASRSGTSFTLTHNDSLSLTYTEYMFNDAYSDSMYVTLAGTTLVSLTMPVAQFSLKRDREGFVETTDDDGKDFHSFAGSIDASFLEEPSSRTRRIQGSFNLTWEEE